MSAYDRGACFRAWDADRAHQHLAGLASWTAYSARWRARQGLPLLHPMDVQYLSPADFCNGCGQPLSPEVQRRRFREYVAAAVACGTAVQRSTWGCRRPGLVSGELGFVRSSGFVRWMGRRTPEFMYGRADLGRYEPGALLPQRPFGVPVVSAAFTAQGAYWLDGAQVGEDDDELGDDSWIAACDGVNGW